MAMEIYDSLEMLEQNMGKLQGKIVKPIIVHEFYEKTYYSIFKV
jgi:predicted DNA-binding protein